MQDTVLRKLFLGYIQIHILHHAKQQPVFGSWMLEELARHGYRISAGTLYPILHSLTRDGLLTMQSKTVRGKIRKYYSVTPEGENVLAQAKEKIHELTQEL